MWCKAQEVKGSALHLPQDVVVTALEGLHSGKQGPVSLVGRLLYLTYTASERWLSKQVAEGGHRAAHNVVELAELGQLRARPHEPLGEVARVARRKADALDAGRVWRSKQR